MNVTGKTVLITGGNKGIGYALAESFAKRSCSLILIARTAPSQEALAALQKSSGQSVRFISCDLSDEQALDQLLASFRAEKLEIDILINNAGLLSGGLFENQKPSHIRQVLRVNTEALLLLTHYFLPQMLAKNSGLIINNASVSGKFFLPSANTYAASKAAVVGFTESLALELKDTGVKTLLMITPGIQTAMYEQINETYKNLDYEAKDGISPQVWAEKVVAAAEAEKTFLLPPIQDESWWGLRINQFCPPLFRILASQKFKR